MEHAMSKLNDLIAILVVGEPANYRALAVYPLKSQNRCAAATYLVLDEALATRQFQITEVSHDGVVPRLLAINETARSEFLLDGEELVGAKQNRVLNLSVMLGPRSKTEIPVSCVESGRWRAESYGFKGADRVQFARGRAQKIEQVSRSLCLSGEAMSDQTAVWNAIATKSARMRVASPTGAMAALFESRRDDLQGYLSAIPTAEDQVGALYAVGGLLVGMEIFDAAGTFAKLAGKLIASYALDAIELTHAGEPPDVAAVRDFIDMVRHAPHEQWMAVGVGETVRLWTAEIVGAALEVDGHCLHLSAFRRQGVEDQAIVHNLPGARIQRSSLSARR
jgi:hypothetical protein